VSTTIQLQRRLSSPPPRERAALERRAKMLAWGGNAWHVVEFAIAVGAGVAAGSVALVGFGIDSVIEALAGGVIVWLFNGGRGSSQTAERRAQQLIAASYALLVAYIGVEAVRDLLGSHHPGVSWVGIGLAAFTAPTMPLLARAKRNVGRKLNSSATVSEASQNMICAYLSIALLVGAARERAVRLVVGRPDRRARDRGGRGQGRRRRLARRGLRLLVERGRP
jgi:divalent metal cation (Fe/Co/Zn/Cd) transporter